MKAKYTWIILGVFPRRKLFYLKLWKCFLKRRKCMRFLGPFWSKKNKSRRVLAERQLYNLPQPSPTGSAPPYALCFTVYLKAERIYGRKKQMWWKTLKGPSGLRREGRKLHWFKLSFFWHLSAFFVFLSKSEGVCSTAVGLDTVI